MKGLLLCGALLSVAWAQVKLPPYTRQVLPNGVVIDLMPRKDVPLVTLRAVLRGGAESDPSGQAGLSALTADLLRRGTQTRSAEQFSLDLDALGANFETRVDQQGTVISLECLSKDVDQALSLFTDALRHATFPAAEVEQRKAQKIDAAKSIKDEPRIAVDLYFRSFFFGPKHPYGRPASGDETSLARIGREQVVDYYRRAYTGRNLILIMAGDFDPRLLTPKLTSAFHDLTPGTAYSWTVDQPFPQGKEPHLLLVDKPDATQTYFLVGQPGIARRNPDRVPLLLVNTLFGGRFTSILNDELRVNTGLTYGASSRLEEDRLTGGLVISTFTKTETTGKAIDLALDLLKRLREKGITAEQLDSAKAYVKGKYPTDKLETADQLADVLAELELFDLDRGEIDNLFQRIDAVTLDQANAVARKYYRADTLTFVLLGNAQAVREAARKYAPAMREVAIASPGFTVPDAAPAVR